MIDEYIFRQSCGSGHIEIASWLIDVSTKIGSPINIHANDEYAFKAAAGLILNGLQAADKVFGAAIPANEPEPARIASR